MGDTSRPRAPAHHAATRLLRKASRSPHREQSLSDWYITGLAGAMVTVGLISLFTLSSWTPSGCLDPRCPADVESSSLAIVVAFSLLLHLAGLAVGPVSVSKAESFWIFSSPMDRRSLMSRRKSSLLLRSVLGGLAIGLLHYGVWNANPWWLVAFTFAAVGVMALAMLFQGRGRPTSLMMAVALFLAALLTAFISASTALSGVAVGAPFLPVAVSATAALVLLLTGRAAWKRPDGLPLHDLRRAQGERDAMAGAFSAADSGLFLDVIGARLLASRSFVTAPRLKLAGWGAILEAETRRCLRSPLLLTRVLALMATIGLSSLLGIHAAVLGICLGTMVFTSLNAPALRTYATSMGLARSFPQSAATIRLLLSLPTAILIVALCLAIPAMTALVPSTPLPLPNGLSFVAAAIAGLAGGIRWTATLPPQFTSGILMSEMGPIPISAMMNAIRGIDAAVLLSLPILLGLNPLFSVTVPLLGLLWVLVKN